MRRNTLQRQWREQEWRTFDRAKQVQQMWEGNRARAIEARSITALMIADEQVAKAYENVIRVSTKYSIR